jgi:hypothetical protein
MEETGSDHRAIPDGNRQVVALAGQRAGLRSPLEMVREAGTRTPRGSEA